MPLRVSSVGSEYRHGENGKGLRLMLFGRGYDWVDFDIPGGPISANSFISYKFQIKRRWQRLGAFYVTIMHKDTKIKAAVPLVFVMRYLLARIRAKRVLQRYYPICYNLMHAFINVVTISYVHRGFWVAGCLLQSMMRLWPA